MIEQSATESISNGKLVELTYKVVDAKTDSVLTEVEFPIGYVHGVNEILAPQVLSELEGKCAGETIAVPIDCNKLFGPRDENLVVTDLKENVPEEYQELGMSILMENANGDTKTFLVTRIDEKTVTIDGNNPLCGRQVIFNLDILTVRDATDEEIELGGPVGADPDIEEIVGAEANVKPLNN